MVLIRSSILYDNIKKKRKAIRIKTKETILTFHSVLKHGCIYTHMMTTADGKGSEEEGRRELVTEKGP